MDNAVNIIHWINPREPIRSALGNLGYQNLFNSLEPDLIRWCIEAQDFISKPKTEIPFDGDFEVMDNKIVLCRELNMVECVNSGCKEFEYQPGGSCGNMVTDSCSKRKCCTGNFFTIDSCYMHFIPEQADGTIIHVKGLARKMGTDGYPMIADICATAIIEYINMRICFRQGDPRYNESKAQWIIRCPQARMELNRKTNLQTQQMGRINTPGLNRRVRYPAWYI